jgi:uncharacterized protein
MSSWTGSVVATVAIVAFLNIGLRHAAYAAVPPHDQGPSFNCSKATVGVEATICDDPALAARDRTLSLLFAAVRVSAAGVGPSNELAKQREWLAMRGRECAKARVLAACVATSYDYRIYDLALAALFTSHNAAMAELKRQTPEDAPIYEAIYEYATISNQGAKVKAVTPLISPTFEATEEHPAQDIGNGIQVPERSEDRFEDIPTAADAVASDEHFSAFIDVAFSWAMDRVRAKLPCGALVRRPGLVAALGQRWDPQTDCEDVLPPTPVLDNLLDLAREASPPCGGTIGIDLGAQWTAFIVAKRLNLPDEPDAYSGQGGPVEQRFRRKSQAQLSAATQEMTRYYSAYFGLNPSEARTAAADVVGGGVAGAFACEREG